MNNLTSTTNTTTTMMMTSSSSSTFSPLDEFNSDWFDSIVANLFSYILALIGITLNTILIVISVKKPRAKEDAYRIIIHYIIVISIVEDIGKILSTSFLGVIFTSSYLDYLQASNPLAYYLAYDTTTLLQVYSHRIVLTMTTLFSINRYLSMFYPIKCDIWMTPRRVHIYCISIIVICILVFILDEFYTHYNLTINYIDPDLYLFILTTATDIVITPTSSAFVIIKLLGHLRVLKNLNERKRVYEFLFISFALLLQGIYAIIANTPNLVLNIWGLVDAEGFYEYYSSQPAFESWIFWGLILFAYSDTTFFALNILLNIRVYAEVVWIIPIAIYRRLAKRKTTVATAILLVNQQPKNIASPAQ